MRRDPIHREFGVVRSLLQPVRGYNWLLPVVIVLGLIASLLEGVSLSLLIPLQHALTERAGSLVSNSSLASHFQNVIDVVPPALQLPAVVLAIFVAAGRVMATCILMRWSIIKMDK